MNAEAARRQRATSHVQSMAVAVGGALGAAARVGIGRATDSVVSWPLGTLVANLVGCFVLGLLVANGAVTRNWSPTARVGAMSGFCGGLTTFSTFALSVVTWTGGIEGSIAWSIGSVVSGVVALAVGRFVGSLDRGGRR